MIKKVLIADDNSANLYMLETMLKGYGLGVTLAENGKDALDKARLNPPDLIITDILMPVMDGYALCRQWKSDDKLKTIPLVFYTATYTEPKDEKFALSLGADLFIIKPQEPDIFMDMLKKVLEEKYTAMQAANKPLGEEMEFFRKHNEILFEKLEKKMSDLEIANQKLRDSEDKYRTILEEMDDVYFEVDIKGNIKFVNPSSCKMSGYSKKELLGMSFKKISAPDGIEMIIQYFSEIFLTNKTGKPFLWNLVKKNGERGFFEIVVSLIRDKQGKSIGFRGIGRDITERRQAEMKLQQTLNSLEKAVGTTIQVLVSAVEFRDPYTAGHQSRVADLAHAIATEMGLAPDKIEGIRMAGSIHDIGKLSIPAEILSKPTKLTNIEFSLIKQHPQSGYEMLKDVESPWPLAQIVYQHHERMNGSGYPGNLKGDEILIEARIMAVADVVEAMASHRPYRPTLGIEVALEEIEKNKGILYDDVVADACMRLFREKGYKLT
ncbi:MAG: HD domain-containing phosphohydrolase [Smithella sp.]